MNHMSMNGLNGVNGTAGGMPMMNHVTNGTGSRTGNDQDRDADCEAKMNTYIYDYFLKHEQFECARALFHSDLKVNYSTKSPNRNRDVNGIDDHSMDTDSKDNLDSKRPDDLPSPEIGGLNQSTSFLLDWFSLFWDMFLAQRKDSKASGQAMQYVQHTQQQSRMRQEQQQRFLQQPGMIPAGMQNYQNMLRMQQAGGMPMNSNELRQRASLNNNRNVTPQQITQMARTQQMLQQQVMQRDGSDGDINGQRPRTPSSGDNAPSPSKRPRLDGPPFSGQMMPNGRGPQGMQGQQMMGHPNTGQANALLMQAGINPNFLSASQLESYHAQNPLVQKKSIQVYAQNMATQHRNTMPQGMPNQGSPMMQAGMEVGAGMSDLYGPNAGQMRMGQMQPNGNGGNHALQDYQMQLMLLEQQNKKRLLMARQEQEQRPDGGVMVGQPGFAPGMSPQGSRSGPSPNPNDQMKRGTPKMGQAGLPGSGSPMPDGSMPQGRGSPAAMNFNPAAPEMFKAMSGMTDGMGPVGPNGMRPPSSHPHFNGQFNPQMEAMARVQGPNGVRMSNANWPQGPQGQAPMMAQPPQAQQPTQMGTPQQRTTTMPPPQAPPIGVVTNGRSSPQSQAAAPPTPQPANKQNPKGKKDRKDRKPPQKKNSMAAATPSSEADNQPPTPTPPTPITPQHTESFKAGKNANGQNQTSNIQAATSIPAPVSNMQPPQPEVNGVPHFDSIPIDSSIDMTFGQMDTGDVLDQFDFDSFLQEGDHDLSFDATLPFGDFNGIETATGDA